MIKGPGYFGGDIDPRSLQLIRGVESLSSSPERVYKSSNKRLSIVFWGKRKRLPF
jgi:hypothetical protein